MADPARRRATYEDVLRAPDHMVAEVIGGELLLQPRPSEAHALTAPILIEELGPAFRRGRGGPGRWILVSEPELHLGDIVVPDLAGWRREPHPPVESGKPELVLGAPCGTVQYMAASVFDPFQVLGVARGATKAQIRAAYRELVARYHPDKHRGNPLEELAAAKLIEINRAYEILSDDDRRAAFEGGRAPGASTPQRAPSAAPAVVQPDLGMKIVRGVGLALTVVFFLKFGLALSGQIVALFRGLVLGFFSLFRLGPIPAIVAIIVIGMAVSFLLRSRKGRRDG